MKLETIFASVLRARCVCFSFPMIKLDEDTAHQMPVEIVHGHQIELYLTASSLLNITRLTNHSGARRQNYALCIMNYALPLRAWCVAVSFRCDILLGTG